MDVALSAVPAQGWIRLICMPGDSANAFIKYETYVTVNAFVDSVARMSNWGESILPVTPGDRVLSVQLGAYSAFGGSPGSAVFNTQFGTASIPLRVAPGQTVTVFYAAPNGTGTPGRFSFTPPPPPPVNGFKVAQIVILAVCLGLLLLIVGFCLLLLVGS
ncbi:hypothetical protein [Tsukamurella paurometabola]|uniref:hypothetical protein n=1 Tax=Tsukamurella paurometabola TaxID=2061 RepID=UPI000F7F40A3|nr:hypothetical protein [Tsukamurella paurometabola]UEA82042.1 hypothetical protein LK411_16895 [Tsukamurella paurometabola]